MSRPDLAKPMDALLQEQRILGESRMIRDLDSVTRETARPVIEAVKKFKADKNVSYNYIAKANGISASTLSEVLRELYAGDWKQIVFDLDRWLEDEAKRDAAPKPTEYVETRVAMDVMTVADATTTLRGIGLVYGPSGIGKTISLKAVAAEKPGSILVSVETAAATAIGLIEALAKELRVATTARASRSSRQLLQAVKEKLNKSGRLIIIDEFHKLCGAGAGDEKSLNVLRDLHDHTECPILLCGTVDLVGYLERRQANGREPLGQIRSRIVISRDLMDRTLDDNGGGGGEPLFSVEEIRKIFAKSKMRLAADAARYLMHLANVPDSGALRTCRNLVIMATKVNQSRADVLTADMLKGAQRLLVNRRAFTLLEARMSQQEPSRPMAKVG